MDSNQDSQFHGNGACDGQLLVKKQLGVDVVQEIRRCVKIPVSGGQSLIP